MRAGSGEDPGGRVGGAAVARGSRRRCADRPQLLASRSATRTGSRPASSTCSRHASTSAARVRAGLRATFSRCHRTMVGTRSDGSGARRGMVYALMSDTLRGLWLEVRVIPVLLWSFSALTLGTALGAHGRISTAWYYLGAVALGVLIQGLLAHTVNEIEDWRSGTDRRPLAARDLGRQQGDRDRAALAAGAEGGVRGRAGARRCSGPALVAARAAWCMLPFGLVGRRRRDPLHAAAGAGRLPAVRGRGDRVRLHGARA